MRRSLMQHPRRQLGERPVRLLNDDQLDTVAGQSPFDRKRLPAARMKGIVDLPLDQVFAGSMWLFRAAPGSL